MRTLSVVRLAVMAQQLAELREDAPHLVELLVAPLDDDGVAARDELHAERVADLLEEAIAAAEEAQRLVAAVELDGQFAHGKVVSSQ